MPSLNLRPDQVPHVRCLPGTALIRCTPPSETTESGLIIKPEAAADWEREQKAVREGVVVALNRSGKGEPYSKVEKQTGYRDKDSMAVRIGETVLYLGRQDEAKDDYVVVKIGQIVAVKETGNGA